jgi:hypothetical protein
LQRLTILQVTLFATLQTNLGVLGFSLLLLEIMTMADEVDSQLRRAMEAMWGIDSAT